MNWTMTQLVYEWGVRCFGEAHMNDRRVRSLRLLEEAMELAQACGVRQEQVRKLTRAVYSRPHGGAVQELGGVLLTAMALSKCLGFECPEPIAAKEISRCLTMPPEMFAKRNEEKNELGLT